MSVWYDIRQKSLGKEPRIEDKYLNDKDISRILESHKVGPSGDSPIRMFYIMNKDDDDMVRMYSVTLKAVYHSDGNRDFNDEENIRSITKYCHNIISVT